MKTWQSGGLRAATPGIAIVINGARNGDISYNNTQQHFLLFKNEKNSVGFSVS
jgi:hypothetical protein